MEDDVLSSDPLLITDAKTCKHWLHEMPLTNVQLAHSQIYHQLNLLNQEKMAALERLKVVEQLREPVNFLQQELQKKLIHKPLPLREADGLLWEKILGLIQSMGRGYQLCLEAHLDGEADTAEYLPLVTQRCLFYLNREMVERFRVYQALPDDAWRRLHQLYSYAELQGFATTGVKDSLNKQVKLSTCSAVYVHALLINLANPYQMSARQLSTLDRWLDKWGVRVDVTREYPPTPALSIIAVDLDQDAGPKIVKNVFDFRQPRYLDMERLGGSLRKRIKFLQKGGKAEELKLGPDCVQPECQEFLESLYAHWCKAEVTRASERRESRTHIKAAFGFSAIYFFMRGHVFKPPAEKETLSRQEIEDLQIFGHVTSRVEKKQALEAGFSLEPWTIEDESAMGFCIARKSEYHAPLSHRQLVGLRPDDSERFLLAVVRWLKFNRDGELQIGVHALPGSPQALAASLVSLSAASRKFVPAFLLPAMPALNEPASLVLPLGWFGPGRQVEIFDTTKKIVRLERLLDKGSDYERASFS